MKCKYCGRATRVTETRSLGEGYVPRRTRVCVNGHKYYTYEVDDAFERIIVKHALRIDRIGGLVSAALLHQRNELIVARAKAGEKHLTIALDFGLSPNMVSTIVRRAGVPDRRRK